MIVTATTTTIATTTTMTLSVKLTQARCSIIFGVEKCKEYAERFLQGTVATGEGYRPKEA